MQRCLSEAEHAALPAHMQFMLFKRAASSSILLASDLTFPIMIDGKKGLDFLSLLVLYLTFVPARFPWRVPLHISPGIRTAGSPASCLIRSSSSQVYVNIVKKTKKNKYYQKYYN